MKALYDALLTQPSAADSKLDTINSFEIGNLIFPKKITARNLCADHIALSLLRASSSFSRGILTEEELSQFFHTIDKVRDAIVHGNENELSNHIIYAVTKRL